MIFFLCSFIAKKKVFLTKNTKYDRKPTYFWLPVVIAEWEVEKWRSGEVGKWGSGEVGKWGRGASHLCNP